MPKQIIINADDYGMDIGQVDGIVHCAQRGVISSTTFMVTRSAFKYGIAKVAELNNISIGVHLDASSGSPVSDPSSIPSLVCRNGGFVCGQDLGSIAKVKPSELKVEFRNQIEKLQWHGVEISHLDNHSDWIYFFPDLFAVVVELAVEFELPIRSPFVCLNPEKIRSYTEMTGRPIDVIETVAAKCNSMLRRAQVQHPDNFRLEFTRLKKTRSFFETLAVSNQDLLEEICVHPGTGSDKNRRELEILCDIGRTGFEEMGFELVTYDAVREVACVH